MRMAAAIAVLVCVIAAAGPAPPAADRPEVPTPLTRLVLAELSDEITPVLFPHGRHAAETDCTICHHPGSANPAGLPGRCRSCHPEHAEEGKPPDL